MKIRLVVAVVVLILLLSAGGGIYLATHHSTVPVPTTVSNKKPTSIFTSIQDAVARSLSLECDYTDNREVHTIAYIKNGQIRADVASSTDPRMTGSVIIKDKKIYYWNGDKTGFVMVLPDSAISPVQNQPNTGSNMMASLESYKKYCKTSSVADSLFALPKDVTFTDESQMMHTLPTGGAAGGGTYAVPTQYQQYMQHMPPNAK